MYSNTAIERVEAIIGDIVEGVSVTATTGNAQSQSALYPLTNNETGYVRSAVEQLARLYRRRTDWSLGRKEEAIATFTLADEMTDPADGYARNLLIANKDFIKALSELIIKKDENKFNESLYPPKIQCPSNFKKCPCLNYE